MFGRVSESSAAASITAAAAHEPPSFLKTALAPGESGPAFWDEVSALHDNDALLPPDQLRSSLERIASVLTVITTLYVFLVFLIRAARRVIFASASSSSKNGTGTSSIDTPDKATGNTSPCPRVSDWKTAYQIANLVVNLALGLLGIYHFVYTITPSSQTSPSHRIEGWNEMSFFGELQIAYQLWAIPVGLFLVDEHGAMLAHHVCVIVVGSMSAFYTNGFRYFTPFFYGVIEISSVPLAVMNGFKADPELAQRFPKLNQMVRLVFAISFLTVRFVMWMPQIYDYLRIAAMLGFTCRTNVCRVGCAMSWLSGVGLTFLQLLWATKIVQGLAKMTGAGGSKKDRKKKMA